MQQTGVLPDGASVSRFGSGSSGGETIDVIIRDDHSWAVHKYASRHRLERSIEASGMTGVGSEAELPIARRLTLKRHGLVGYQLDLRLIEAVALP